jgi:hypothetical protein
MMPYEKLKAIKKNPDNMHAFGIFKKILIICMSLVYLKKS